jgi:hypothetical protein
VLVIVVVATAMKMAAATVGVRKPADVPTALMTIALAAINITLFVARHLVAYAIARVVAIAITFVGSRQRGRWQGRQEQWQ